ncbi:unnamed protein product [Schistocephalus solidus]|uniref:Uncharacterized protein n=1 Tax=Schistocephalus solidus TaxID=70667 RepID=A0A183T2U5_SCHSO|nr:unnamed protein product [Schistocephalus solidus]
MPCYVCFDSSEGRSPRGPDKAVASVSLPSARLSTASMLIPGLFEGWLPLPWRCFTGRGALAWLAQFKLGAEPNQVAVILALHRDIEDGTAACEFAFVQGEGAPETRELDLDMLSIHFNLRSCLLKGWHLTSSL